ncbi:MAG: polysaccharide deacetylase family protein [Parafilimonas sp.]|nr:polysaccharide deacetylase family protein [Parafilimonas sp.]
MHTLKYFFIAIVCLISAHLTAQTEITKWQDGKIGAVSLTYDDGSINQFKYALPVMERLQLPATFYIITGPIPGSKYPGKFIGRPVADIIAETATVPADSTNYFERVSAAKYLDYIGANAYYDSSAILFEDGKIAQAYHVMDALYNKVRNGELKKGNELSMEVAGENGLTWDSIKAYASRGYEFSSHTITHAHMAVLDTTNMFYELEKSKEDIRDHLGEQYTFDAEIPFGIEHPRALKYGLPAYDALRNMMTDEYMQEINRGYKTQPGSSGKEYVQWQRGATTKTPLPLMKAWVDTTLAHNNIWLVLVFHGIDGLGYEALSHELLDTYFQYIKKNENKLWVATFGDVARYMRERMHATVKDEKTNDQIVVHLQHSLDANTYNVPLTLKTYVPANWKQIKVKQGNDQQQVQSLKDVKGNYILYHAMPGKDVIELSQIQ